MARYKTSKVAKELNIGLSTAVEFLQSKGISVDMNPNSHIDEDAYRLLKAEYDKDKDLKIKSEQISSGRQKERVKTNVPQEDQEIKLGTTLRPTVVGHIDLDDKGQPIKKAPQAQPKEAVKPKETV